MADHLAFRRLLVTGGAGFIGSNFVHYWRVAHPSDRVVVLDALTYAGSVRNLEGLEAGAGYSFVHGDITDTALVESLMSEERIDTVTHFAAESHVDRSIAGPDAFIRTNINGTYALLDAARKVWLGSSSPHRFHHVSTDEVYGSLPADRAPSKEGDPYSPSSPYAASKAASDHLVHAWARTYGLQATTSHCSNNYGPRQYPEKLIPLAITRVLEGKPIPLYGDGRNLRDWLHVNDLCRGLDLVLQKGVPGEVYHLGGGESSENLDLVRSLCRRIDAAFARDPSLAGRFPLAPPARGEASESLIGFVADRPGHDRRYAVDGSKALRELGFEARIALEEGLSDTVNWYLTHR